MSQLHWSESSCYTQMLAISPSVGMVCYERQGYNGASGWKRQPEDCDPRRDQIIDQDGERVGDERGDHTRLQLGVRAATQREERVAARGRRREPRDQARRRRAAAEGQADHV